MYSPALRPSSTRAAPAKKRIWSSAGGISSRARELDRLAGVLALGGDDVLGAVLHARRRTSAAPAAARWAWCRATSRTPCAAARVGAVDVLRRRTPARSRTPRRWTGRSGRRAGRPRPRPTCRRRSSGRPASRSHWSPVLRARVFGRYTAASGASTDRPVIPRVDDGFHRRAGHRTTDSAAETRRRRAPTRSRRSTDRARPVAPRPVAPVHFPRLATARPFPRRQSLVAAVAECGSDGRVSGPNRFLTGT